MNNQTHAAPKGRKSSDMCIGDVVDVTGIHLPPLRRPLSLSGIVAL